MYKKIFIFVLAPLISLLLIASLFFGGSRDLFSSLHVVMQVEESDVLELYWDYGNGYSPHEVASTIIEGSNEFKTFQFLLSERDLSSVRLDPVKTAQTVRIREIAIVKTTSDGEFDKKIIPLAEIAILNEIQETRIDGEVLVVVPEVESIDPQLMIPGRFLKKDREIVFYWFGIGGVCFIFWTGLVIVTIGNSRFFSFTDNRLLRIWSCGLGVFVLAVCMVQTEISKSFSVFSGSFKNLVVNMEVMSEEAEITQLFWSNEEGYNEEFSIIEPVYQNKQVYKFRLPLQEIKNLRWDLLNASGVVVVDSMYIEYNGGKVEIPLERIFPGNAIERISIENEKLIIKIEPNANDPFVFIYETIPSMLNLEKAGKGSFALIICILFLCAPLCILFFVDGKSRHEVYGSGWFKAFLLLVLPGGVLALFVFLDFPWVQTRITVDPYLYTAYIRDYQALIADYGYTYYGNRLSHLLPSMLFVEWFGDWYGYLTYRIFLWYGAFIGICLLGRRFCGFYTSLGFAALFVIHPWCYVSLFWEHYDSTALVLMVWLACFLVYSISDHREKKVWCRYGFLAGLIYLLAGNANSFLIGVGGALWLAQAITVLIYRGFKESIRSVGSGIIGFLIGYFVLLLIVNLFLVPNSSKWHFDLFSLTLSMSAFSGWLSTWYVNVWDFIQQNNAYQIFLPFVIAVGVLLSAFRILKLKQSKCCQKRDAVFVGIASFFSLLVYFVMDRFEAAVFTHFFYFVYLMPVTWLGALFLIGNGCSEEARNSSQRDIITLGGILLLCFFIMWGQVNFYLVKEYWLFSFIVLSLTLGIWLWRRLKTTKRNKALILVGSICLCSAPLFNHGGLYPYSKVEGDISKAILGATIKIGREVREVLVPGAIYKVWYYNKSDRSESSYNSARRMDPVNSYFIWRLSQVQDRDGAGMPHLSPTELQRIVDADQLLLLGFYVEEIEDGLSALREAGFAWEVLFFREIHNPHVDYYYSVIRFTEKPSITRNN